LMLNSGEDGSCKQEISSIPCSCVFFIASRFIATLAQKEAFAFVWVQEEYARWNGQLAW
jgi:hypothetical protein